MHAEIEALIAQANELPESNTKLALLKSAMDLADLHQIPELSFWARLAYSETAGQLSQYALTLPHFPILLNYTDKNPQAAHPHRIFYLYTVALFSLVDSPEVKKDDLIQAALDLENRMMAYGIDRLRILQDLLILHFLMGNLERAEENANEIKRDFSSEGLDERMFQSSFRASLAYSIGFYLLYTFRWNDALKYLQPIILAPNSLSNTKFLTRSLTLTPMAALGDPKRAIQNFKLLLKSDNLNAAEIAVMGDMMSFSGIIGDWEQGISLLERSVYHAFSPSSKISWLVWLRGVNHLLKRLPPEWWTENKLRLPTKHPLYRTDGQYPSHLLLEYYSGLRQQYLTELDTRNGHDAFSKYHRYWDEMADSIRPETFQLNS